jgi:hypothetical protein
MSPKFAISVVVAVAIQTKQPVVIQVKTLSTRDFQVRNGQTIHEEHSKYSVM